ncbi:MAG: DUF4292 domain-containing protein [Bacteroidetes bacterium]|nr:DUF4292 domain-containing protein [Bacteroidota bacterium]
MNRQCTYFILLLSAVLAGTAGCSNTARMARGKPLKNLNVNQIIEGYETHAPDWEWMGMKLDVKLDANGDNESFKASVRMAKDSVIWMSISPALGVEVARVLMTPDSVLFISKIPGNKFYFSGNYDALGDWIDTPLSFQDVQSVLAGQPMGLDPENDKFISKIDGEHYALIGKYKGKVKRLVGVNDNSLSPEDSLDIQLPVRRYERLRNRTEDEDLLIKRHWFGGITFEPVRDQFDDLYYQRSLILERLDYEETEIGMFPRSFSLLVTTVNSELMMNWETLRIRFDRAYDFPFEVPEGYERRLGI